MVIGYTPGNKFNNFKEFFISWYNDEVDKKPQYFVAIGCWEDYMFYHDNIQVYCSVSDHLGETI